ncbi:hypothetical protein HQ531_13755, partial [bacterium]|nr:hypothetical protein [bacterium]
KKVRVEFVEGDDYSHAKQKYVKKSRRIDRDKNEYTEKVTDPDTGEVIHDVKEDLNNHWGHGSAKEKKSKNGFSPAAKLAIGILVGLPLYSIYVGELSGSVSMMWILVVIILIFFGDR